MQNKAEAQPAWLQLAAGAVAGAQLSLAKQAGTELDQAQLKLRLDYILFVDLVVLDLVLVEYVG